LIPSYVRELEVAEAAAREAGEVLVRFRCGELRIREKLDRTLVTDADLAAEAVVLRHLRAAFPADGVLSEECGATGPDAGRQWIVDPLDGTTNFSRGLPFGAVSIALWEGGEPAVGVVYLPFLEELFAATRYSPAMLNGRKIHVSDVATVEQAMINCYFDRHERLEPGLAVFGRVARACEGRVKILGSTASMLCYVACGRLEAQVKNGTKVWDFAAGLLILERAGGRVTDFDGRPLRETGQSLLATNGRIHEELANVIREE
jgi:myo-inositol-1(or 4)-monophosphatase